MAVAMLLCNSDKDNRGTVYRVSDLHHFF